MKKVLLFFMIICFPVHLLPQSVCIDSVMLNGNIPRVSKLTDLIDKGILIDSIVKTEARTGIYESESYLYSGTSYFEYYPKNNNCEIRSLIFDDKISNLSLGKHIISKFTTWTDLKRMFPNDCSKTYPVKYFGERGYYETCGIPIRDSKGQLWDMKIVFRLRDDKVVRVDFWEPM